MKGCWLMVAAGVIGLTGCVGKPKRDMRQPQAEVFATPPPKYDAPPEYPRDERGLTAKTPMPFNMAGVGQPGGGGAPGGSPSAMGGARR